MHDKYGISCPRGTNTYFEQDLLDEVVFAWNDNNKKTEFFLWSNVAPKDNFSRHFLQENVPQIPIGAKYTTTEKRCRLFFSPWLNTS